MEKRETVGVETWKNRYLFKGFLEKKKIRRIGNWKTGKLGNWETGKRKISYKGNR